ncbi:MAG: hypothetical protein ACOX68_05700 [Candidatus Limivicinus sp.]|jgi:hypothetical protein
MIKNDNIRPRALSSQEKADMEKGVYDSFANYICFCHDCGYVDRTNMYLMRAKEHLDRLKKEGTKCPVCGKENWELGYPMGSKTGFVDYN